MLSSQTKDPVVGAAMIRLREGLGVKGLSLEGVIDVSEEKLRELLYGVGFHNNKAKYIKNTAVIIKEKHESLVPDTFDALVALPGVGPKMALIVLNVAFEKVVGVSIDTHLHRMCEQLGWVKAAKNPEQTRAKLEAWLPLEHWHEINLIWVGMGQELQTEKIKLLNKALDCTQPRAALLLLRRLGMDIKQIAEKAELTERVREHT